MTVAAVDRCIRLIELLAATPDGCTLTDLSSALGSPKSAVHRTLATLAAHGYVVQDARTQLYAGSLRLATLGFRCLDARHLPDAAQQVLNDLARETQEYCRLALASDSGLAWVARAQGAAQGLRYEPPMSHAVVLHATASGKAWLATMPENEALAIACARGLAIPANAGANVVTSVDALRRHLADTRRRGFAIAHDEAEDGTWSCAIAFRGGEGDDAPVVGTISVAGPDQRMRRHPVAWYGTRLAGAAAALSAAWPLQRRQLPPNQSVAAVPARQARPAAATAARRRPTDR